MTKFNKLKYFVKITFFSHLSSNRVTIAREVFFVFKGVSEFVFEMKNTCEYGEMHVKGWCENEQRAKKKCEAPNDICIRLDI